MVSSLLKENRTNIRTKYNIAKGKGPFGRTQSPADKAYTFESFEATSLITRSEKIHDIRCSLFAEVVAWIGHDSRLAQYSTFSLPRNRHVRCSLRVAPPNPAQSRSVDTRYTSQ